MTALYVINYMNVRCSDVKFMSSNGCRSRPVIIHVLDGVPYSYGKRWCGVSIFMY